MCQKGPWGLYDIVVEEDESINTSHITDDMPDSLLEPLRIITICCSGDFERLD